MKKSILFGALAMFAIGAMSIQDANAQNADVKSKKAETTVSANAEKAAPSAVKQEPVKQKKDECCGAKAAAPVQKKGECCGAKAAAPDQKKGECCGAKAATADQKKGECCANKQGCAAKQECKDTKKAAEKTDK